MILQVTNNHIEDLLRLALILYKNSEYYSLKEELTSLVNSKDNIFFLYISENDNIAFCHCSIRKDYVEGSKRSPVGYLEGIYIKEQYRGKGIAKELLTNCELWIKQKGCLQFASDCTLDNTLSEKFHLKNGFKEANKIIHFIKDI